MRNQNCAVWTFTEPGTGHFVSNVNFVEGETVKKELSVYNAKYVTSMHSDLKRSDGHYWYGAVYR